MAGFHFLFNAQARDCVATQVEFSPFDERKVAVATAQNFGVAGSGKQYVLHHEPGKMVAAASFDTKDGVYDCSWSETNEFHLAFASGDGTVKLWDLKSNKLLRNWAEHSAEVYSVDWNLVNKVRRSVSLITLLIVC